MDYIIILFAAILGISINLFAARDKTYVVYLKNIETNVNFRAVVKSLSKRKAYEVVSKYLIKEGIPYVIVDITNTIYFDKNNVLCTNIYIGKK